MIGLTHGLLITKLRLQPFVVTLCGLFVYRGMARYIAGDATQGFGTGYTGLKYLAKGMPLSVPIPGVGWVGFPMPIVILAGVALLAILLLNYTIYGRYLYALGRNEIATRFSGINTDRMIILAILYPLFWLVLPVYSLPLTSPPFNLPGTETFRTLRYRRMRSRRVQPARR